MRASGWLLLLLWCSGCERLQNSLSLTILECGPEARNWQGLVFKVLDPNGLDLDAAASLEARPLLIERDGSLSSALPVSSRGCVQASAQQDLMIRSQLSDRRWSRVVNPADLPWDRRVRLQESSQQLMRVDCSQPLLTAGELRLPLVVGAGTQRAGFAVNTVLEGTDGTRLEAGFALQNTVDADVLRIPQTWPDGAASLRISIRDLALGANAQLSGETQVCELDIDRRAPTLQLDPKPGADARLELIPGEKIHLRVAELHPKSLRWCLAPALAPRCQLENEVASEVNIITPASGRWLLQAQARDALGHESKLFSQELTVIQQDLINTIVARTGRARAEQLSDGLQAARSMLGALIDFERLVLPEEITRVENQLIDTLLEIAPRIRERNRQTVSGQGRRVWTLPATGGENFLVLTDSELTLWTRGGRRLDRLQLKPGLIADWSETQQSLIVADAAHLQLVGLQAQRLSLLAEFDLSTLDISSSPRLLRWIPEQNAVFLAPSQAQPVILQFASNKIASMQTLKITDATQVALDSHGSFLAAVASDSSLGIWQLQGGNWQQIESDERSSAGLQFVAHAKNQPVQLILLSRLGSVSSWTAAKSWQEIDKAPLGEVPKLGKRDIPIRSLQAWQNGEAGLIERGGRFFQWHKNKIDGLQSVNLEGAFDWDKLQQWQIDSRRSGVWLQDNLSISFWEWRSADNLSLVKIAEWPNPLEQPIDFSSSSDPDHLAFVSLDGSNGHLRFWTQNGPSNTVSGDSQETTVNNWWPLADGGEQLVTAGFDGVLRFWSATGKKLAEFIGHAGQVNEVQWLAAPQNWLSSAEDGSTRIWDRAGKQLSSLELPNQLNARLRDAALLTTDFRQMVTTGSGLLAFWTTDASGTWTLQKSSLPLAPGLRGGMNSLRLRPDGAIMARFCGPTGLSAVFYQSSGQPWPAEAGLPKLEDLSILEANADATVLAVATAGQPLQIFRQTAQGWLSEELDLNASQWSQLSLASWSPDSQSILTVFAGENLVLWQQRQGIWRKLRVRSLPQSSLVERGIHWRPHSQELAYTEQNQLVVLDSALQEKHRLRPFPESSSLGYLAWSEQQPMLSVSRGARVRILDFNLSHLRRDLCLWLTDYLESTNNDPELETFHNFCARYPLNSAY